jgi:hypothetical protein
VALVITDRNPGESIADWIDRANDNCCGCGWVVSVIEAVRELEAQQATSEAPASADTLDSDPERDPGA